MIIVKNEQTKVGTHEPAFVHLTHDTLIQLDKPLKHFNPELLVFVVNQLHEMRCSLVFSFDDVNWSKEFPLTINQPLDTESVDYINRLFTLRDFNYFPDIWIGVKCSVDEIKYKDGSIKFNENVPDTDYPHVDFIRLEYDGFTDYQPDDYRIKSNMQTINRHPVWNLYDNTQVYINQWLDNVDSVTQRVGHVCVYFKTIPLTTNHTLQVVDEREVVSIKRMLITFPGNTLPKDTMQYTEWDYAMMDESFAEVNWRMFQRIFGLNTIPSEGDFFFFPIVNKMFKVTHVEPEEDKKFMGKIGWFNVYINKFTDNDTTSMSQDMNDVLFGFDEAETSGLIETTQEFLDTTVRDRAEILKSTNEEKKAITHNYSNKLVDSTGFTTPKETDAYRKSYNERLDILSINPDQNSFPVTMYDCSKVGRKILGIEYSFVQPALISNLNLLVQKKLSISFNFVLIQRHSGPIFEFLAQNLAFLTLNLQNDSFSFTFGDDWSSTHTFPHKIVYNEYYQINVEFEERKIIIAIYLLRDKTKKIIFQDMYIVDKIFTQGIKFDGLTLMGGNFYMGETQVKIDDTIIMTDYVTPVLKMQAFGRR